MRATDYKTIKQASDYYHKRFAEGKKLVNMDETLLINKWFAACKLNRNTVGIDLGTGTGRVIHELLHRSPKTIYAVDNSPSMLSYINKLYRNKILKNQIKPLLTSSDKLLLPPGSVDLATSLHLFKHLKDINPTLKEVSRILKPKGYFIFEFLNRYSLIGLRLGSCYTLDKSDVIHKLNNYGLKVIDYTYLHLFGETVYNVFGSRFAVFIHRLDKMFGKIFGRYSTKIFILSQKI